MAHIHGMAGEWARVKGTVAGLWPVFLATFAAGFATAFGIFRSLQWGIAALCVVLVGAIFGLMHGLRRIERFFVGARGEERVSRILAEISDKYHVFNDFVAGTKFWRGRVTIEDGHILVDGRLPSRAPLSQVLREAAKVKAALAKAGWDGPVTPVLVFASDTFQARVADLNGAVVINSRDLAASFATERVTLAPSELDRLVSLMENNT